MSYAIYLRKSRKDLEVENVEDTLKRHETLLKALAVKQRLNVTHTYKEVVSGETISARPQMQLLLQDVENNKYDGVLVVEIERLARGDTMDQGLVASTFKYSNTKIITPSKTYNPSNEFDEEYFEFGLFMSRREYQTINRRLTRGKIASVKEGKWIGSIEPYGYKKIKLEGQKGYTLEPIPEQAEQVKIIFDLYTCQNLGSSNIAKYLNSHGYKHNGNAWQGNSIIVILKNPIYAGLIRYGERARKKQMENGILKFTRPRNNNENIILAHGLHPPIISEEVWNKANEVMKSNTVVAVNPRYKISNPLAGIMVCKECGKKLIRRPHKVADTMLICSNTACSCAGTSLDLAEKRVLYTLNEKLERLKVLLNGSNTLDDSSYKKSISNIDSDIEKTNAQLNKLQDLLETGVYSIDTYLKRSNLLTDKISKLEQHKKDIQEQYAVDLQNYNKKNNIIPSIENVLNTYSTLPDAESKNNLLKSVIDRVVYYKKPGGRWKISPDDFTTELYLKF